MRLLLIDNYDSFTWNLVHLIGMQGAQVEVCRNDVMTVAEALQGGFDGIVLSPGPGTPREAGICIDLVKAAVTTPIFGVCLGLQAIGEAFGGRIVRAGAPMHGKVSRIHHHGRGIFRGINGSFAATRYHSLVIDRDTCPADLSIEAQSDDGLIMAVAHETRPTHGVQFHPESILSEQGAVLIRNFLDIARSWHRTSVPVSTSGAAVQPITADRRAG